MNESVARRAGLFHDIGKAVDYEREGTHPEIGAEVATRCGEHWEVINAVAAHHEDVEVTTPITILVATADALSGARPGARTKSAAEYIRRIEQLEGLANGMEGVEQSYALQAGPRDPRHREHRVWSTTRGSTFWPPISRAGSSPRWTTREDQGRPSSARFGRRTSLGSDGCRSVALLLVTAAATAAIHTLIPDHWLPFVLVGRARGWSAQTTAMVSGFSAVVHTLLSIGLGSAPLRLG